MQDVVNGRLSGPATITINVTPVNSLQSLSFTCTAIGSVTCPPTFKDILKGLTLETISFIDPDVTVLNGENPWVNCYVVTLIASPERSTSGDTVSLHNYQSYYNTQLSNETSDPVVGAGTSDLIYQQVLSYNQVVYLLNPLFFQSFLPKANMGVNITVRDLEYVDTQQMGSLQIPTGCIAKPATGPFYTVNVYIPINYAPPNSCARPLDTKSSYYTGACPIPFLLALTVIRCATIQIMFSVRLLGTPLQDFKSLAIMEIFPFLELASVLEMEAEGATVFSPLVKRRPLSFLAYWGLLLDWRIPFINGEIISRKEKKRKIRMESK